MNIDKYRVADKNLITRMTTFIKNEVQDIR